MIIATDFDGTLCKNRWPEIGEPNTDLIRWLKARRELGDKVILWTCRSGKLLTDAVAWCRMLGLRFDAVNENLKERIEAYGGDTRKVSADWYLDDRAAYVARISPFPVYIQPGFENRDRACWTAK